MKKFITKKNITIIEALKKISKNGQRHLLIVDKKKVIGILSEGDIRREILNKKSLNKNISKSFKKKFLFFKSKEFNLKEAKKIMLKKKIYFAPILNESKNLVDIVTTENLFGSNDSNSFKNENLENTPVIIMAGGKGTRMRPFTKVLPKLLLPAIKDKSVIEVIIEKFLKYKKKNFILTVNYKSKIIKDFFNNIKKNYRINFYEEKSPLGTVGALAKLKNQILGDFFLINSDTIIDVNLKNLYSFHKKEKNDITIVAASKDYNVPYGTCRTDSDGNLKSIVEKPQFNLLVNTGLYLINSNVIKFIPENKKIDMDKLIALLIRNKKRIKIFSIPDKNWQDVGKWTEYEKFREKNL